MVLLWQNCAGGRRSISPGVHRSTSMAITHSHSRHPIISLYFLRACAYNRGMPWDCPIHGSVKVIACGLEGYLCTEDISDYSGPLHQYQSCNVPVGREEETLP